MSKDASVPDPAHRTKSVSARSDSTSRCRVPGRWCHLPARPAGSRPPYRRWRRPSPVQAREVQSQLGQVEGQGQLFVDRVQIEAQIELQILGRGVETQPRREQRARQGCRQRVLSCCRDTGASSSGSVFSSRTRSLNASPKANSSPMLFDRPGSRSASADCLCTRRDSLRPPPGSRARWRCSGVPLRPAES